MARSCYEDASCSHQCIGHACVWRRSRSVLLSSTQMHGGAAGLGMIPACVHPVMQELGLIGMRIQRMPTEGEFGNPMEYPYLTVRGLSMFSVWTRCVAGVLCSLSRCLDDSCMVGRRSRTIPAILHRNATYGWHCPFLLHTRFLTLLPLTLLTLLPSRYRKEHHSTAFPEPICACHSTDSSVSPSKTAKHGLSETTMM